MRPPVHQRQCPEGTGHNDPQDIKTPQDISRAAAKRIEQAIQEALKESETNNIGRADISKGKADKTAALLNDD